MWKNAFKAAAAALCLASSVIAAEGSRLSLPNLEAKAEAEADTDTASAPTLRPARISIAQGAPGTESTVQDAATREPGKPKKSTRIKTSPPKKVVSSKSQTRRSSTSSRRTAAPPDTESTDRKITFRPVEVRPLEEDARHGVRSSPTFVGEVQYPVVPSQSLNSEATAEYEEDDAAEVAVAGEENLAPIVSAADLPRPGRQQPMEDASPVAEVIAPPVTPQPAAVPAAAPAAPTAQDKSAAKEPGRLSSILKGGLRLPEFRSRKSSE